MQGYLAYYDGKVTGWCNANEKQIYDSVNFNLPWENPEKNKKIKSIVCFCISPDLRGRGIASQLLEQVCADAAADGYEYVEAYPFDNDANHNYHGSKSMYDKNGFTDFGKENGYTIVRKYLK